MANRANRKSRCPLLSRGIGQIQLIYCNILCLHSRSSRHHSRNHSSDPDGFSEQPISHREQSRPQLHLLQSFRLLSGWHTTSHQPWAASSLHTVRTCRRDGLPTLATANPWTLRRYVSPYPSKSAGFPAWGRAAAYFC